MTNKGTLTMEGEVARKIVLEEDHRWVPMGEDELLEHCGHYGVFRQVFKLVLSGDCYEFTWKEGGTTIPFDDDEFYHLPRVGLTGETIPKWEPV